MQHDRGSHAALGPNKDSIIFDTLRIGDVYVDVVGEARQRFTDAFAIEVYDETYVDHEDATVRGCMAALAIVSCK